MTTPNHDHLTAHDTYESVRDFFDPELQRQWDKVLRATRRAAFAAAYDTIVNADPSADRREVLHLMADLVEIVHSRTSISLGCPTTWDQTWPVAGSWPISRFSMMRICLGGFSLPCRPRRG